MRVLVYRRQSLDRNNDELGIDRQLKECLALVGRRGWPEPDVITDNDTSASKRGRKGYAELVRRVRAGEVDVVVILRIDRLLRLNDELEELIRLVEQHPVKVVTVEGDVDITTPQGRLVARILVSVAQAEMEVKSARHKLANEQKAAAGKPHGSRRPYGYEADLVTVFEPEAAVLREMASRFIAGHSCKEIAYWANGQGHTTTTGRPWYPLTVRNMLLKKRYAGIRQYKGAEYPAEWEAVFSPAVHEALQMTLRLRHEANGDGRPDARTYLLTGLLFCGRCGNPLNGAIKSDRAGSPKRRGYYCRSQGDTQRAGGCGGVRRNADALEHFITELVMYRLDTPDLGRLLEADDEGRQRVLHDHLLARHRQRQRVDELVDDYAMGLLNRQEFANAKRKADEELQRLDDLIEGDMARRVGISLKTGQTVRAAWESAESEAWKRQLLRLLIERVVVKPGTTKPLYVVDGRTMRFDPELIEVRWKV